MKENQDSIDRLVKILKYHIEDKLTEKDNIFAFSF